MPNGPDKPRFEPPPWEREAFDRFEQQRASQRAVEDGFLEHSEPAAAAQPSQAASLDQVLPQVRVPEPVAAETKQEAQAAPLPEARIDSMLIQLRAEEPRVEPANVTLVNIVCATLTTLGLVVIVQSTVFFARVGPTEKATTLLAGTLSFVVFMTGLGMLAGAWMLFRKYHR